MSSSDIFITYLEGETEKPYLVKVPGVKTTARFSNSFAAIAWRDGKCKDVGIDISDKKLRRCLSKFNLSRGKGSTGVPGISLTVSERPLAGGRTGKFYRFIVSTRYRGHSLQNTVSFTPDGRPGRDEEEAFSKACQIRISHIAKLAKIYPELAF